MDGSEWSELRNCYAKMPALSWQNHRIARARPVSARDRANPLSSEERRDAVRVALRRQIDQDVLFSIGIEIDQSHLSLVTRQLDLDSHGAVHEYFPLRGAGIGADLVPRVADDQVGESITIEIAT